MSVVHPDNALNELTGEEWLYFTRSIWTTADPSGCELRVGEAGPQLGDESVDFVATDPPYVVV